MRGLTEQKFTYNLAASADAGGFHISPSSQPETTQKKLLSKNLSVAY